jgi:NNP family nitrate/nitrite transporter-like MFS transporter
MMAGGLVMTTASQYELAIPGVVLLGFGMGICNAAVFKMVPQMVPQAVGGAAGWVGGVGAFGGFAIPPMMAFAVRDLGRPGYTIGFVVFIFLALFSLSMAWILKYSREPVAQAVAPAAPQPAPSQEIQQGEPARD